MAAPEIAVWLWARIKVCVKQTRKHDQVTRTRPGGYIYGESSVT